MGEVIAPTWTDLKCVFGLASKDAILVTPYYSGPGLDVVESVLPPSAAITVVTTLRLEDWAAGVADPPSLLACARRMEASKHACTLHVSQQLHAKCFLANRQLGLVGSANLTAGGFERNIEMMVLVEGEEAEEASAFVDAMIATRAVTVPLDDLERWVAKYEQRVRTARRRFRKLRRRLHAAEEESWQDLGFSATPESPVLGGGPDPVPLPSTGGIIATAPVPDRLLCDGFTSWLLLNQQLPGAQMLYENATDTRTGRNQGHFRRFFGAAWLFLHESPKWRPELESALKTMRAGDIFELPEPLLHDWLHHLERYQTVQINDVCSYPLVKRYLPERYGGTVTGGGGGVSTFKRMFPLVAKYITDEAIPIRAADSTGERQ